MSACMLVFALLAIIATPAPASAASALATAPRWTRALAATAPSETVAQVLLPLSDGLLLVRDGAGVIAIDARGVTHWSMPNVDDAIVDGAAVVFRRANVVFAVRSRDSGMLWKRPCDNPPYVVGAGENVVTMCDGQSTVLRARDGRVLARREVTLSTSPPSIHGARRLNDDYALVANFFDGAWMGEAYYVVDAHTGAFLWSETDFHVVDVSPTTIAITPYPSMLPWAPTGRVETRRLADGAKVHSENYAPPKGTNDEGRGILEMSRAATYVSTMEGNLFRFRRGGTREPLRLLTSSRAAIFALGDAAFILADDPMRRVGALYLDRPSRGGVFATRLLGQHAGYITAKSSTSSSVDGVLAVRLGDRLAVPDQDVVRLYDESGAVDMTANTRCPNPQLAMTRTMLYALCGRQGDPASLLAFPRH